MGALLGCLVRLLVLLVVCAALFVGVLWFAGNRPALGTAPISGSAPAAPAPAAATATPDAAAAAAARRKLATAAQQARAAPPGSHRPVSVTLSEAELNAVVVPELQNEPNFPLSRPYVVVQPGVLSIQGQAAIGPASVPVTVHGGVTVQDGLPRYTVTSVQAAGINAPQPLVDQLSGQLNNHLTLTPSDLPITVQTVTLGEHTLTIAGVTK